MNNYKFRLCSLVFLLFIWSNQSKAQCGTVTLPSVINACKGGTVLIPATYSGPYTIFDVQWSPSTGLSDYTILSPTATVGISSIAYNAIVRVLEPTNLITNGDFSAGATGFATTYHQMQQPPGSPHSSDFDSFTVDTNPGAYWSGTWPVVGDHTTGSGKMLMVDGSIDTNDYFWGETIPTITPSTYYLITFWTNYFTVPSSGKNPVIGLDINGKHITYFEIKTPVGSWKKHSFIWNSLGATNATIVMKDTITDSVGNDFAIDDISVQQLCLLIPPPSTVISVSDFKPRENFIAKLCKKDVLFSGSDSVNSNVTQRNWNFGDGNTDTGVSVNHTFATEGSYTVVFKETDKFGCTDSAEAKVSVVTTSKRIKVFGDTLICKGVTVQLLATGGLTYAWNNKATLNDSSIGDPKATPTVPTTYTVTAVDSQGCTGKDSATILFFPPITLHITPSKEQVTCANSTVQLFVSGANKYIWQPGLLCDNNTLSNPVVSPPTTTTFYVYGTDGKGCDGYDSITVLCLKDTIYIPNAFTPNGDGVDDVIAPTPYCDFIFKNFSVYNRWGQLMFSTDKQGDAWDGTHGGQPQEQGVYVYVVRGFKVLNDQVDKNETVVKGNITLLR